MSLMLYVAANPVVDAGGEKMPNGRVSALTQNADLHGLPNVGNGCRHDCFEIPMARLQHIKKAVCLTGRYE